jgi:hypothetical protein
MDQYQKDLDKDIRIGDLVRVVSYGKTIDGICRVVDRHEIGGTLFLDIKRLIKYNGVLVKNSKTTQRVLVAHSTKITFDKIIDEKLAELERWREHLK